MQANMLVGGVTKMKSKSFLYAIVGVGSLLAASFTGINCSRRETRTELSDVLHEDARIVSMEHRNAWLQPIRHKVGKNTITTYIRHSEKNKIEFGGKVDFEINNKAIYERFKEGDLADISYRENYKLTFEDLDGDGKKEETGRVLKEYVFVDAVRKD